MKVISYFDGRVLKKGFEMKKHEDLKKRRDELESSLLFELRKIGFKSGNTFLKSCLMMLEEHTGIFLEENILLEEEFGSSWELLGIVISWKQDGIEERLESLHFLKDEMIAWRSWKAGESLDQVQKQVVSFFISEVIKIMESISVYYEYFQEVEVGEELVVLNGVIECSDTDDLIVEKSQISSVIDFSDSYLLTKEVGRIYWQKVVSRL